MRQIKVTDVKLGKFYLSTSPDLKKKLGEFNVSSYIRQGVAFKGRYLIEYTGKIWHNGVLCDEEVLEVLKFIKNSGVTLNAYKSFNKSYKEEFEDKMIDNGITLQAINSFYTAYEIDDMIL